ncbi:hypothetical protein [Aeoliella mucimassa]|uniref:Uncharacterized protein n=1 Tax=Aeoliella mucimassa TaxID=2527972 RepID=A0A518AMC2_9BACT|nr:hypothetical protein [Aeoliella mucimassa]QDU55875.1 hypothetical protein Pan181_20720 [Aeoliella mucimassa]
MAIGSLHLATLLCVLGTSLAGAQTPATHPLHAGAMQPGAIGSQRLLRGGPLSGYTQPVEIRVPEGTEVGMATGGHFQVPQPGNPVVGLRVGCVYRLKVTGLFDRPGEAVFPTVELIDRLYPPPGTAQKFPVPIDITAEDLELAARGMFVTRVIYVEDPNQALPVDQEENKTTWVEARPEEDPLQVADAAGRPIAILRLGGRDLSQATGQGFTTYGDPPVFEYQRKPSQD